MGKPAAALTRRNVVLALTGVGAVGIAVAAPKSQSLKKTLQQALRAGGAAQRNVSLANGSYEDWRRAVGATFAATGGYRLKLVGVRPMGSTAGRLAQRGIRSRGFVALFDVLDRKTMAGEIIYTVQRASDRFPIFLAATGSRSRMQAMFG